jgi:hypothetical protein
MMAQNREPEQQGATRGPFSGYAPGRGFPLGAYAGFVAAYKLGLTAFLGYFESKRRLPARLTLGDGILLGLATHKLSRIAARDWVTSPLRAPFTRYQGPAPGGEVDEVPRGTGLRRAVGELISCPFCMGPWIAGGLMVGLVARPRITRVIMGIFAAVTTSDFLHRAYALLESRRQEIDALTAEIQRPAPDDEESAPAPDVGVSIDAPIEEAQVVDEERR